MKRHGRNAWTSSRRRWARRRGSALVLALIAAVVMVTIGMAVARTSVDEARSTGGAADRAAAFYAARAAVWVAGRDLADGGTGDLRGRLDTEGYTPVTAADADGDGFGDFSPVDASVTGAFEARGSEEGPGVYRVRARGVQRGVARVIEAIVSTKPTSPFQFGLFGTASVGVQGTATTDGYDSRSLPYLDQPIVGTNGLHLARGVRGHIASDGDVLLDGSVAAFGDVAAGGTISASGESRISGTRELLTYPMRPARPTWSVPPASDPSLQNAMLGLGHGDPLTVSAGVTVVVPGKYVLSSLRVDSNATLVVTGGPGDVIELFVTGNAGVFIGDQAVVEVAPPGPLGPTVVLRVEGPLAVESEAILNGTRTGTMGDPAQLQVYSRFKSGSALGVRLGSKTRSAAAVYAPSAPAQLEASAELFGAVVSARLDLTETPFVHFDEALRALVPPDAPDDVTILSTREVR